MKVYALYHGDKFIDLGSIKYLAELLGVKEKTIRHYATNTWLKRSGYRSYIVIKIEDEDENNRHIS